MTHVSKNLPNNLIYNFPGFNEVRKVASFDGIRSIPFHPEKNANEIIVDNEDKGFSYQQALNQAFLKSKINRNKQNRYKYSRLQSWNPEREWKAVLRSEFYGENIHSAYYTRSGSGERKATWKTALPESGSYEVYFYLNRINADWRRNNRAPDYNLTVYHEGGAEKVHQTSEGAETGWMYLGTFQISDTGKVELSNKSNGDMVVADAVKWVRVK